MASVRLLPHQLLLSLFLFLNLFAPAWAADHEPSPIETLDRLKTGNKHFAEGKLDHPRTSPTIRKELANGQKPDAIVLSCSDSRVPPELLFEKGLGELFVVRVAGNVLGSATVASIEYAAEHLGSRLIIIMGHESCGAIKTALNQPRGKPTGSFDLDSLISTIQGNLDAQGSGARTLAAEDKSLRKPAMANVDSVAADLVKRSKLIRELAASGKVRIVRAIYGLESGKVDFWDAPEAGVPYSAP